MRVIKKREGEGVEYCYLNKIRKGLSNNMAFEKKPWIQVRQRNRVG
jgi:hypothetical protein